MKLHRNAALSWSGRRRLARRVVLEGQALAAAARAAGVSVRCARKWLNRYRAEGELGLCDRSSAPRRVANRTQQARVEAILALRRLRLRRLRSPRPWRWRSRRSVASSLAAVSAAWLGSDSSRLSATN